MKKFDAITSLRFIASAAVVVAHSCNYFGFKNALLPVKIAPVIAFFFVLSGFILTYVYPSLNTREKTFRFFIARFARLWPMHIAGFILLLCLLPKPDWANAGINMFYLAIANILLIHAWIPNFIFASSYNDVTWSLSNELFFYLLFPILIYRLKQNWWLKLIICASIVILLCKLGDHLYLPHLTESSAAQNGMKMLVYICPLMRLLEFFIGMCAGLLWHHLHPKINFNNITGTLLEIIAFTLVLVSMHFFFLYSGWAKTGVWSTSSEQSWLALSGAAPFFALLILVISFEKGFISKLLSMPALVTLGEMSYAIYLTHKILVEYFISKLPSFSSAHGYIAYTVFWGLLLMTSYLFWHFIEVPCQRFIVNFWSRKTKIIPEASGINIAQV